MLKRYIEGICFNERFGRQMRFIAGPRQVGKTTLAKDFQRETGCEGLYYNWDLRSVKDRFKRDPYFYNADATLLRSEGKKWICFDEIHKFPKWKNILKDAFDSFESTYKFIVTGSARLDLFRRSGDSLSGRYFMFRLMPVSLFELTGGLLPLPTGDADEFIKNNIKTKNCQTEMEQLLNFGGFPEPLLKGDEVFSSNWHEEYIDTLIKEDLRDLTKIHELENVATLFHLLPERVGAPFSLNSLREDLEISYNAAKNYVNALILTYIIFSVSPYSKKLARTLKKEKKVYFYDWTLAHDDSKRFENFVACELKHRVELWNVSTKHKFDLFYIRTRDGKETDFLVTRDESPYFLAEAKLSAENFEQHNLLHARHLGQIPIVQLVSKPGIVKIGKEKDHIISASNFF